METQTVELPTAVAAPRRTFRQRISSLMDHILMKMDEGSTTRHENARFKAGNLLGAATSLCDALDANADSDTIGGDTARFSLEAGQWDRTETLQKLAAEHGVACRIESAAGRTTVDLAGATRATVLVYVNAVINQTVTELKDADHYESA